jgi:hypothetical protein
MIKPLETELNRGHLTRITGLIRSEGKRLGAKRRIIAGSLLLKYEIKAFFIFAETYPKSLYEKIGTFFPVIGHTLRPDY